MNYEKYPSLCLRIFFHSQGNQVFLFSYSPLFPCQPLLVKMIEIKAEILRPGQLARQEFKNTFFLISREGK